jgi:hypothetical protein
VRAAAGIATLPFLEAAATAWVLAPMIRTVLIGSMLQLEVPNYGIL